MGGMMGMTGMMTTWMILWIFAGFAVVVTGIALAARALSRRHRPAPPQVPAAGPSALQEARNALRMRYARGEISREDYLQGKVELEDG